MEKEQVMTFADEAILSNNAETGESWTIGGNAPATVTNFGTTNDKPVTLISNNARRGILTADGLWGFGITAPVAQVHIKPPVGNIKAFQVDKSDGSINMTIASNGRVGIGTGNPVAKVQILSQAGENPLSVSSGNSGTALFVDDKGGVSIGSSATPPAEGLFVEGNTGIGTNNPEKFKLKILHENDGGGLAIQNKSLISRVWEFFAGGGNGPLNLRRDGNTVGQFNVFGQYLVISDERLKTNIQAMPSVLEKINQLKPSTYQFKDTADKQEHDGFIAQEVMKVFPSLVSHTEDNHSNTDMYSLNYDGFGVIAIKAIQELQQMINEQKQTINTLGERLAKVEATLAGKTNGKSVQGNSEKQASVI